jgi:predicted nucleic acid-binding protein
VRYGVAEIKPRSLQKLDGLNPDLKFKADSRSWKEMVAKIRNPLATLADIIILATARAFEATIWTQDADFKEIPGVRFFSKRWQHAFAPPR